MAVNQTDIPALLHDARLTGLDWDESLARLRITFACLRRHTDGSLIEDPSVAPYLYDWRAVDCV